MTLPRIARTAALPRRTVLRAAGAALALPLLDAMIPRGLAGGGAKRAAAGAAAPKRFVAINTGMGLLPRYFAPDDGPSPYLALLERHRERFTAITGLSHPEVDGGHHADVSFLTAAPHPGAGGFRNTISVDQFAAERIGHHTRVPSLALQVGGHSGKGKLSWTASGVMIPSEDRPARVYRQLFTRGNPEEVAAEVRRLRAGRSILDAVADRSKGLAKSVGAADRDRLDEYFTSVRDLEGRLVAAERWEHTPKPVVSEPEPEDIPDQAALLEKTRLMQRMLRLALQTDSTRVITLSIHSYDKPHVPGVTTGHHPLTHHGNRPAALAELRLIEEAQLKAFAGLLDELNTPDEAGGTLLENTAVLYGSHLGDANRHDNTNLPIVLAGGGYRHGRDLSFARDRNAPLGNLFVSLLQGLGVEADRFASGTGTLTGLEAA